MGACRADGGASSGSRLSSAQSGWAVCANAFQIVSSDPPGWMWGKCWRGLLHVRIGWPSSRRTAERGDGGGSVPVHAAPGMAIVVTQGAAVVRAHGNGRDANRMAITLRR